jgi:hypothetical protein
VYFSVSVTLAACEPKLNQIVIIYAVDLRGTTIKCCGGAVNCVD